MIKNSIREMIVEYYEVNNNEAKVAKDFNVHVSTVSRIIKRYRETGSSDLHTQNCGRKRKLTDEEIRCIDELVQKHSNISVTEIRETLQLAICDETIRTTLLNLGYRYHKKPLHTWERDCPQCEEESTRQIGSEKQTVPAK